MEVCPVFRATQREELSPRGKKFLLQNSGKYFLERKRVDYLAGLCAGCKKCLDVCPQKINLPLEIARLKSAHPDWKSWIWSRMITSGPKIMPVLKGTRAFIPSIPPIIDNALADKNLIPPVLQISGRISHTSRRAVLFPGCVALHLRPGLHEKAIHLLDALGFETIKTPDWKCCGYPLGSAGLFEQEKREREKNLQIWVKLGKPDIFVLCATCLDGLKNPFFSNSSLNAQTGFRQKLFPLIPDFSGLNISRSNPEESRTIFWHEPCHGSGQSRAALDNALSSVNLDLTMMDRNCCGMGGSFAVQHPQLSRRIADIFWQNMPSSRNNLVLTDCSGCIIQLEATSPDSFQAAHWLEAIVFTP